MNFPLITENSRIGDIVVENGARRGKGFILGTDREGKLKWYRTYI